MKISGKKLVFILIPLLIVALAIFLVPGFRYTIRRLSADFYHPFFYPASLLEDELTGKHLLTKSKIELSEEIIRLNADNDRLLAGMSYFESVKRENHELKGLLGLLPSPVKGYKCIFAEITYRDPLAWDSRFTANRGSDEGVVTGAIVLASGIDGTSGSTFPAVAGRIEEVGRHSAVVKTIADPSFSIGVLLGGTNAPGILEGAAREGNGMVAFVRFIPANLKFSVGEKVVTSLFSASIPPQLPIGEITDSERLRKEKTNPLYRSAAIRVFADLDRIHFIAIMVPE